MVIVINTTAREGFDGEPFIIHLFENLSRQHPDHQFFFITSSNIVSGTAGFIKLKNDPSHSKGFLNGIKYRFELKKNVKKLSPNIVVTASFIPGLKSTIKQYLLAGEMSSSKKWEEVFRNLNKISGILSPSEALSTFLKSKGVLSEKVITIRPFAGKEFNDVNDIKEDLKETIPDFPFLLLMEKNPDTARMVLILKAFSAFKKRLKSSMKLMIPVSDAQKNTLTHLIKSYKYRNDVLLVAALGNRALLNYASRSYAVVINTDQYGFDNPTGTIISAGSVIIASNHINNSVKEYAGDNAFYYTPGNSEELADILNRLYKDEELRNRFIQMTSKEELHDQKMIQMDILEGKLFLN